jgi:dephospho-CoA kinase
MLLVGLTGSIGSGKSTVSAMLSSKGARIIDGDKITRELQSPGTPTLARLVEEFGDILHPDGSLDRARLAGLVFADEDQLARLNAVMRPVIASTIEARIDEHRGTDHLVVLDMPLLVEHPRKDVAAVIVVDIDPELAIRRLVDLRAMSESDARARLGVQATREERLAAADYVIDNNGTVEQLATRVEAAWEWMHQLVPQLEQ